MKYSKATNYALHTILYLIIAEQDTTIGVQPLAQALKVSPTYLSKILSKLVKADLVESAIGVKGGYKLAKAKETISFLQVIEAIEGSSSLFNCELNHTGPDCLIQNVMAQSEAVMEQFLAQKKLLELVQQMDENTLAAISSRLN